MASVEEAPGLVPRAVRQERARSPMNGIHSVCDRTNGGSIGGLGGCWRVVYSTDLLCQTRTLAPGEYSHHQNIAL
jgi:hypothetical protein